jgi:hypothetical protein
LSRAKQRAAAKCGRLRLSWRCARVLHRALTAALDKADNLMLIPRVLNLIRRELACAIGADDFDFDKWLGALKNTTVAMSSASDVYATLCASPVCARDVCVLMFTCRRYVCQLPLDVYKALLGGGLAQAERWRMVEGLVVLVDALSAVEVAQDDVELGWLLHAMQGELLEQARRLARDEVGSGRE